MFVKFSDSYLKLWPFRATVNGEKAEYTLVPHENRTYHCGALVNLVNSNKINLFFTRMGVTKVSEVSIRDKQKQYRTNKTGKRWFLKILDPNSYEVLDKCLIQVSECENMSFKIYSVTKSKKNPTKKRFQIFQTERQLARCLRNLFSSTAEKNRIFFLQICSKSTFIKNLEFKEFRGTGIRGLAGCLRNRWGNQGEGTEDSCTCFCITTHNCSPGVAASATSALAATLLAAAKAKLETRNLQKPLASKTLNAQVHGNKLPFMPAIQLQFFGNFLHILTNQKEYLTS